jgi:hypothetical protein
MFSFALVLTIAVCMHMSQVEEDFKILQGTREGDLSINSQSADNNIWTVSYERDNGPMAFYIYDRLAKKPTLLFESRQDLGEYTLTSMTGVMVPASDGLSIPCYIALPAVQVGWQTDMCSILHMNLFKGGRAYRPPFPTLFRMMHPPSSPPLCDTHVTHRHLQFG